MAGLATLPFGWIWPSPMQLAVLIASGLVGGMAHIVLTSSYRYAPASLVAPLDYTTMVWAFVFGYAIFGELPTIYVYAGSAVVAASGIFVIGRARQIGLRRIREAEGPANVS
jgi:drug/metabolite transporter (DMT)-like permease